MPSVRPEAPCLRRGRHHPRSQDARRRSRGPSGPSSAQGVRGGEPGALADGDVGKGAGVDQAGLVLHRVAECWIDRVPHPGRHGARDLEILQDAGYEMTRGVAVDQFPWTNHVETVVLLTRQNT